MTSQPDGGSSHERRHDPAGPRHHPAENHSPEPDGNVTVEDPREREAARRTDRRIGLLSYGVTAVALASILLAFERDLVPVPESALGWVTIGAAVTMVLVALGRFSRTRSRQQDG